MNIKHITQKRLYWTIVLNEFWLYIRSIFSFEKVQSVNPLPLNSTLHSMSVIRHSGIKPREFKVKATHKINQAIAKRVWRYNPIPLDDIMEGKFND